MLVETDHQNECEISKEEIEFSESDETVDEQERKNAAATKIQAGYRGHRDRKRINELKDLYIFGIAIVSPTYSATRPSR